MKKCEFEDCSRNAKYAVYQYHDDGTKTWGHFCNEHEKKVVRENSELRRKYPDKQWHDPAL